jgi:hypothetical protein
VTWHSVVRPLERFSVAFVSCWILRGISSLKGWKKDLHMLFHAF